MKLTEQQRELIVNQIVIDMNEYQTTNYLRFDADEFTLRWFSDEETYMIIRDNGTWDYCFPNDLEDCILNLSDASLTQWLMEDQGFDTESEIEEYFTNEQESV